MSGMDFYSQLIGWTVRLCGNAVKSHFLKFANSDCEVEQGWRGLNDNDDKKR